MWLQTKILAMAITTVVSVATATVCADEKDVVAKTIFDAQRAGYVEHDYAAYMSQWADDAKLIGGRTNGPGPYDYVMNRKQIESARRMLFRGKPGVSKVEFAIDDVKIESDRATLRVKSTTHFEGGTTQVGEIYRLRKTPKGWKVYENRWWLIERNIGDRKFVFDAKALKRADAAVKSEKRLGNRKGQLFALLDACRFKEAHEVAKAVTSEKDATAEDWLMRGFLAIQVGDTEDSKASYLKALSLDKDVDLPPYAAGLKKKQD